MHNCPGGDNPSCVNPDHLFLGTKGDNIRDCHKKGRAAAYPRPGAGNFKLTESDRNAIYERREKGESSLDLAAEFKISKGRVNAVIREIRANATS